MQKQVASKSVVGLRIIAIYKLCKTVLALGVAWGLLRLVHADLETVSDKVIAILHLKEELKLVQHARDYFVSLSPMMFKLGVVESLLLAALFAIEGIGLWLQKKWAEWVVIVNSGLLIPIEVWKLFQHFGQPKMWVYVSALIINLVILYYVVRIVWLNRNKAH